MIQDHDKVRLLSDVDIFDVYACQELLQHALLSDSDRATVNSRIYEIHSLYVEASKSRIRSEARFCGNKNVGLAPTLQEMLVNVRKMLMDNIQKKLFAGKQVNLMQEILGARQMAGLSMEGIDMARVGYKPPVKIEKPPDPTVDPAWFTRKVNDRIWDNPRWTDIANAYLYLEKASNTNEMILAIDRLNQLQHNSFHILIDLQSGRMLEDRSEGTVYGQHDNARLNVQKILDICANKVSVYEFLDKLSTEIANLLRSYRATKRSTKGGSIERAH